MCDMIRYCQYTKLCIKFLKENDLDWHIDMCPYRLFLFKMRLTYEINMEMSPM